MSLSNILHPYKIGSHVVLDYVDANNHRVIKYGRIVDIDLDKSRKSDYTVGVKFEGSSSTRDLRSDNQVLRHTSICERIWNRSRFPKILN